ncbi:MAG: hypothetical protein J6B03_10980 [Candidatus Homeothermus sp.]|nr:hypothetical protein [Candidatus Homeothermus sp.]
MKKIFQLLLTVALCAAFTACKDEVGIPDRGPAGNPEKEAVGVYEGTWTVNVNQDNGAVNVDYTAIGTLTLADGGMAYVADVTAKCDAADFQAAGIAFDMTSKANISKNSSNGFYFYNTADGTAGATNGFCHDGKVSKFYGSVDAEGVAKIHFQYIYVAEDD